MNQNIKHVEHFVDQIIGGIIGGIKKELDVVQHHEQQLFSLKIFRIVGSVILGIFIVGAIFLYSFGKYELRKKNNEIKMLSSQINVLNSYFKDYDDPPRLKFMSHGDSLISKNNMSDLTVGERNLFLTSIWTNSCEFNIDPYLVLYMAEAESNFMKKANSSREAKGILQLLPSTYKLCCYALHEDYSPQEIFDLQKQVRYSIFYTKCLVEDCNSMDLALSRYNAGHTFYVNSYAQKIIKKGKDRKKV